MELQTAFQRIGARAKVRGLRQWEPNDLLRIDISTDKKGEFFDLAIGPSIELDVIALDPKDRHAVLMRRDASKSKFLVGHDERHWFVAAIPEQASVTNVASAKRALQPQEVADRIARVNPKHPLNRKNEAYKRQGEWFFIPANITIVPDFVNRIHQNEPLQRGRNKPHMAEYLYRIGGETVYVNDEHPNGVTEAEFNALRLEWVKSRPLRERVRNPVYWRRMTRNAEVYVKGRITHPDHSTVVLADWHRVAMNRENESKAMQWVAFLD